MQNKKQILSLLIISILVITIGLTYAYYMAQVQGTGNTNAESSARTATVGEVEFYGEDTFDTTNIGRDIYPGFIGVQKFTIGPYSDGHGVYEIDLQATVPTAFNNDIKLTIYKTSDSDTNSIDSEEGSLTVSNNRYVKQDNLLITGSLTKVYEGSLKNTDETVLEQVEFNIDGAEFETPDTTPDGFYTYYAVYEYLDNGNQNSQQGLDFNAKITVKYVLEVNSPAKNTLEQLQALNPSLTVSQSTMTNPNFARKAPQTSPGAILSGIPVNSSKYVTYASDFTYDETTGVYTLTNYTTCKYSSCYNDLIGKYMILNEDGSFGTDTNIAITESYASKNNEVARVNTANSEGNIDITAYIGSELNEVKIGTWQAQATGLYELPDDYGTSYYFSGDVTDNYVKFGIWQTDYYDGYVSSSLTNQGFTTLASCESAAGSGKCTKYASAGDDMYWRIIRINGDGSIRMIYDGTSAHGKTDLEYDSNSGNIISTNIRCIGKSEYTDVNPDGDYGNVLVGYMYGTSGSDNYNDTHANIINSTIKTRLDSWYQSQMTNYASYISDTLFCNDRSVASGDTISYANSNFNTSTPYTTNASGTNWTIYGAGGRKIEQFDQGLGNRARLTCPNKNDAFTVSDTMHGNGALDYPVGLITIDEANIAGGVWGENYNYYLTTGGWYWTGSPYEYSDDAYVNSVDDDGSLNVHDVDAAGGVRPVINLKSGSLSKGSGTASNPYMVE